MGVVLAGRHWRIPSASRSRLLPAGIATEEVRVAQQILQSMGIRSFTPQVTAAPAADALQHLLQEMAEQIQTYLREQMPTGRAATLEWKK